MAGQTVFNICCACGYKSSILTGVYYEKVEEPWLEVYTPKKWQQIKRILSGRKLIPKLHRQRNHNAQALVPYLNTVTKELGSATFETIERSPSFHPIAIRALENKTYLRQLGVQLDHPGPTLTCPKCRGSDIEASTGMHLTLMHPDKWYEAKE